MSYQNMKRNRTELADKLTKKIKEMDSGGYQNDDRFWYPEVDKDGNGLAVIRFHTNLEDDEFPWVRVWSHSFKGPTGEWYIENSLTTIGKDDPVGDYNSMLWNKSDDDESPERKQARAQKRRLEYVANIRVIKDKANPSNEGKDFLFRFGKQIFDKIQAKMSPDEDVGEKKINPFDWFEGCDFVVKIGKNEGGYRTYIESYFKEQSAFLGGDDDKLEAVYNKLHPLKAFIAPDQFKDYDTLKAKLDKVLCLDGTPVNKPKTAEEDKPLKAAASEIKKAEPKVLPSTAADVGDGDGDDTMSFLQKLSQED